MRRLLLLMLLVCCCFLSVAQHPASVSKGNVTVTTSTSGKRTTVNTADTTGGDSTQSLVSQGIIYNHKEMSNEELSSLVHIFHYSPLDVKIEEIAQPDMEPTNVEYADPLDRMEDYYLSRGYGQVHYSLFYRPNTSLRFQYQPDANGGYSRTMENIRLYQTQSPYTSISFGSSMHSDYRVGVSHTQNIIPRWNIAFNADFIRRDGVYTQSSVKDKFFDFSTNYYSSDARYQLQAGIYRQVLEQDENGGVSDDSLCWTASTYSGVPVELYAATNKWRSTGIFVHQSYNTVKQFDWLRPKHIFDTIRHRDTITGFDTIRLAPPHIFNTGVFAFDVEFNKYKRNYFDNDPSHFTYHFMDTVRTYDSTATYSLATRLFWTNDAYMAGRWKNPWVLTVGVSPEIVWAPTLNADNTADVAFCYDPIALRQERFITINPFFKSRWLLKKTQLELQGEMVTGSYRSGDHRLSAVISRPLGPRIDVSINGLLLAKSPDFIYYQFSGNNAHWYYADDYYEKQHTKQISLQVAVMRDTLQNPLLSFNLSATTLDNVIFCDGSPTSPFHQYQDDIQLLQASLRANLSWGWLHLDLLEMAQNSNRQELLDVPLFASKNSLYADFPVFHGAMRLQTGVNVKYFSSFNADAWKPYYGLFTAQRSTLIGNYVWCDFFVTAQIKRACIYVKISHWNALLESDPHYFTLPHYPGENLNVYFGATWKFFN